MLFKDQPVSLTTVIDHLENCINEIISTGDLSEWMSADGMALLKTTLAGFEVHKRFLARLSDPSLKDAGFYLWRNNLEVQIENYDNLLLHLMGTLKLARDRQTAKALKPSSTGKETRAN